MFFTITPAWYHMALLPGIFISPSEVSSFPGPEMTLHSPYSSYKGQLSQ